MRSTASRSPRTALLSAAAGLVVTLAGAPAPAADPAADPADPTIESALAPAREAIAEGRYSEARRLLDPVRSRFPEHPAPYLYLGTTYYAEKRWESALRNFRSVLARAPDYHTARLLNGWCHYYLGNLAASRTAVETYLDTVPDSADANFLLGLVDLDEDRLDAARRQLTHSIELVKSEGKPAREGLIRARLSDLHLRAGELAEARLELWRALRLDPGNEKFYFKLSRVLQRLGDDEGARLARENDPDVLRRIAPAGGP